MADLDKRIDDHGNALCASCDRCRARKTKCDGKRPCSNCAAKYMKKNKVMSVEGVDVEEFECVYSPAKRRGPVPGRSGGQTRKANEMVSSSVYDMSSEGSGLATGMEQMAALMSTSNLGTVNPAIGGNMFGSTNGEQDTLQQLSFLQQKLSRENDMDDGSGHKAQRIKLEVTETPHSLPRTLTSHSPLLDANNPEGNRLRAYYKLSIDELYRLPPTPTNEEYLARLNVPGLTVDMIPGSHLAALAAARFAELALGAVVHNEFSLGMELCNAVVHCLRESVQDIVQETVMFEVAKAYFLLGVFRAFRGDMERYFKYRRVCMTYLSKMSNDEKSAILTAAVSYLDSWAYMIYNANEKELPNINDSIPPVGGTARIQQNFSNATELKYGTKTDPYSIACDPKNQNWIQGAPPVYLNNEAPLPARSLDALACAVRTCCDQANNRFAAIAKEAQDQEMKIPEETIMTPTTTAVLAHENELCSRNMVLSAYALLQQFDSSKGSNRNEGYNLIISAMDAFLENSEEDLNGGFSDGQIQSLVSVCTTAVENPFLLHHAGPTYHMVTNAAILLCHLLNGLHVMRSNGQFGPMERTMFEEVLDTFIAVRKLLTIHRRKLPVKLRCHGIPRPSIDGPKEGQPFIDLGETLLCPCRGCQGFVLMACSPCVAAERARAAHQLRALEVANESETVEIGEFDKELDELGAEFDLDDDALLNMISNLVST